MKLRILIVSQGNPFRQSGTCVGIRTLDKRVPRILAVRGEIFPLFVFRVAQSAVTYII